MRRTIAACSLFIVLSACLILSAADPVPCDELSKTATKQKCDPGTVVMCGLPAGDPQKCDSPILYGISDAFLCAEKAPGTPLEKCIVLKDDGNMPVKQDCTTEGTCVLATDPRTGDKFCALNDALTKKQVDTWTSVPCVKRSEATIFE